MKKEYIYAFTAIFFWSTTATAAKLLLGSFDSMQVLMISSLFATVFLLITNAVKGNLRELLKYRVKDWLVISSLGLVGIFGYHLFLYVGIDKMEASQAFIINYLWPIMTVLFACIILREKMTLRKGIAIFLSFAGVVMVTANGNLLSIEAETLEGAFFCVLAAVSYGLFSVLNKKVTYNKQITMMLYYFVSFLVAFVYVIATGDSFTINLVETAGFLWNGIFTTAVAYTAWALALDCGDTAKISNLAYITPFLSLIWTTFILGEKFNPWSLAGLLVIVVGIFVQLKEKNK